MQILLRLCVLFGICFASIQAIPQQGQKSMYSLTEVRGATPSRLAPTVEVNVSPVLDYDLPHVPLSFKLNVVNLTEEILYIGSPVQSLYLRFNAPDSYVIEMPRNAVGPAFNPERKGNIAAIVFKGANENGNEVAVDAAGYQIAPGGFLEITIETEQAISERILAALENSEEKFVDVVVTMSLINLRDSRDSPVMRSESMRLRIPKAEG
jgi:hypothetical protein